MMDGTGSRVAAAVLPWMAALMLMLAPCAFAGGVLEVRVTDGDGPTAARVLYGRWDEAAGSYVHVHSRALSAGKDRIALAPGRYRVRAVYTKTLTPQERTIEGIELADGVEVVHEVRFEKATAVIQARDSDWDWRADARIRLHRWDETAGGWTLVRSRRLSHRETRERFALAPGEYKAQVTYLETQPETESAETTFAAADGETVSVLALFRHGPMPRRRKHDPLARRGSRPALTPNETLTERTDNRG